jgi:hypothetical protein
VHVCLQENKVSHQVAYTCACIKSTITSDTTSLISTSTRLFFTINIAKKYNSSIHRTRQHIAPCHTYEKDTAQLPSKYNSPFIKQNQPQYHNGIQALRGKTSRAFLVAFDERNDRQSWWLLAAGCKCKTVKEFELCDEGHPADWSDPRCFSIVMCCQLQPWLSPGSGSCGGHRTGPIEF